MYMYMYMYMLHVHVHDYMSTCTCTIQISAIPFVVEECPDKMVEVFDDKNLDGC